MAKLLHKGRRTAVKTAAHKATGRSASVMRPEYLAESFATSRILQWRSRE